MECPRSNATDQKMGPSSTRAICSCCNSEIYTNTIRKPTSTAWWSCVLIALIGCFYGCCLIPFCMDSCIVVNHTCPKCGSFIGQYRT